jgi:protein-tyrosine phosphatase
MTSLMVSKVLVVCVGNICRSPVGERILGAEFARRGAPIAVGSAGLGALVGHPADETAAAVALSQGVDLSGHVARQFTPALGRDHQMILVMEPGHRHEITRLAPDLSGRVMLFDHWTGAQGVPDPYRRPRAIHEAVFERISRAAVAWAQRLAPAEVG